MYKKLKMPNGEEHGLMKQVANSCQGEIKNMSPETKTKIEKRKKDHSRTVKARYVNRKGIQERFNKPFCLGHGEPIQQWKFIPEQEYELPKGLVEDVNDPTKRQFNRSDIVDADGIPVKAGSAVPPIHEFVPVGF